MKHCAPAIKFLLSLFFWVLRLVFRSVKFDLIGSDKQSSSCFDRFNVLKQSNMLYSMLSHCPLAVSKIGVRCGNLLCRLVAG